MVVIVILLITYRSPVLWMLPIICAVVANTVATGVVYLLAKYADLTVNGQSQAILSILVIGAATFIALLVAVLAAAGGDRLTALEGGITNGAITALGLIVVMRLLWRLWPN